MKLRLATYNIHKCKGMDGLVRPSRIAAVMRSLMADVIATQEVLHDQAKEIAGALPGYSFIFGENRRIEGNPYGNATFLRREFSHTHNHDLSHGQREPRGVLQTDVEWNGRWIHIFNCHLGTSYAERRVQSARLLSTELLLSEQLVDPVIVCGDFNEWMPGSRSRELARHFQQAKPRRSYPGLLPLLRLDHIYYDHCLELGRVFISTTPLSALASDHLPVVADFTIPPSAGVGKK